MLISFGSQKGQSTAYIIIFIIVIVFAVMLTGGGGSLLSGNEPSSVIDTPTPGGTSGTPGSTSGTGSPTGSPNGWGITVTFDGCKQGKTPYMTGHVKVDGPTDATVELSSATKTIGSQPFVPTSQTFPITLSNDDGFGTSAWKITVSSGAIINKMYNGTPTGC